MTTQRRIRRSGTGVVVSVGLLLVLSACSAPSKIAVRILDGHLTFSICQRASANRIEVSALPPSGGIEDLVPIWSATGKTGTHDSVTFSADHLPGESVLDAPPEEVALQGYELYLHYDIDVNGVAETGLFGSWDADDVSDSYWLDTNGQRHEEWCVTN